MAIHLVAVAKVPFLHIFKLSALLWPFNLYFPVVRNLPRVCNTISTFSTLFAFRLRQILTVHQESRDRDSRWERALRLFHGEFRLPGPTQHGPDMLHEASLHGLLAISL